MNEICLSCRKHTKCGRAKHETIGCGYYVPMTNEEFLRSCSTEELAEFITQIADLCHYCGTTKKHGAECVAKKHGYCAFCSVSVREWLQEKHK